MNEISDNRAIETKRVAVNIELLPDLEETYASRNMSRQLDDNIQSKGLVILDALDVRIEQLEESEKKFEA